MAVNVRTFNIGDIDETTVFYPDGTGQVFTPNFSILGASFAKKLSDNTSVGLTANYVRESFGRVSASGVAYDLGVQYKGLLGREGLDVGFALKNFGSDEELTKTRVEAGAMVETGVMTIMSEASFISIKS